MKLFKARKVKALGGLFVQYTFMPLSEHKKGKHNALLSIVLLSAYIIAAMSGVVTANSMAFD
ncbi:hypothetical protein MT962_003012 [Franconibacter sp. IITDAS19]|uniref:hypothetical protein n=1 Tax=Franconibacter sp. IITDAS19 TaxID=2930569 RepID=UPI001FFBE4C7|nr:hypothetical protein [Franconibacter sp. IITDAS19]MCK1969160.1 hypothetical protein [Franconibacter sp. IITDAS19]